MTSVQLWHKALLSISILMSLLLLASCSDENDSKVLEHMKSIASIDGNEVLLLSSQDAIKRYGEEGIAGRIDDIYRRLQVSDVKYEKVRRLAKEDDRITMSAEQVMVSDLFGEHRRKLELDFVYESESETWKLDWKPELLLHGLTDKKDLIIETIPAKRGTLTDRQGRILAKDQADGFRQYPLGPVAGAIVGYVRNFNPQWEEGKELEGTPIGRLGFEEVFDERLRPTYGAKVYVEGQEDLIYEREAVAGEDIATTLDIAVQQAAYDTIAGEFGAVAAFHPRSGQALALVSTPSFHPEDWSSEAMSDENYYQYRERGVAPSLGSFSQIYTPGSTQKLPTILAGFRAGTLTQESGYNIYGKRWQPDHTWGGYSIHRVIPFNGWVDLYRAIVYSDNIFFARTGLDMGTQAFEEGLRALGYDEEIPGGLPVEPSQISEDDDLDRDVALADSAYGQYQVKISPLHLALIYSSLANDGTIMTPLYSMDETPTPWKKNVARPEDISFLNRAFRDVIDGNHTIGYRPYAQISGKTGTAETGPNGKTYMGWFVGTDLSNPTLTMTVMISPVNDRGESDVPTSYFAQILDKLYATSPYAPAHLPAIPVEAETAPEEESGAAA